MKIDRILIPIIVIIFIIICIFIATNGRDEDIKPIKPPISTARGDLRKDKPRASVKLVSPEKSPKLEVSIGFCE